MLTSLATGFAGGQVVTDGSLGPAASPAGPNYAIPASLGATVGTNLFHSFTRLDLAAGELATFSGPPSVTNVLARVTGGSPSSIDGTLRCTIAGADVYLINPAGVVFGPNASLDISGSFVVTTANVVKLADGGRFNAAVTPGNDVLTTAAPAAFGFLAATPAGVDVRGELSFDAQGEPQNAPDLAVADGKSLSIVAGPVSIAGGRLRAPGGRVALAGVAAAGDVPHPAATDLSAPVDTSAVPLLGDVELSDGATISVNGARGGRVGIAGRNITVTSGSIFAFTGDSDGLGVALRATDTIRLVGSQINSTTFGIGRGGGISLDAASIVLEDADVRANTATAVADLAVSLDIDHSFVGDLGIGLLSPDGTLVQLFTALEDEAGDDLAATIFDDRASTPIAAGQAPFTGEFRPAEPLAGFVGEQATGEWKLGILDFGPGDAGTLNAWSLRIGGQRFESSDVPKALQDAVPGVFGQTLSTLIVDAPGLAVEGLGAAGDIQLRAGNVQVLGGAGVLSASFGDGRGGNVTVAADRLTVHGAGSALSAVAAARGPGGNVTVVSDVTEVLSGGKIFADTEARGAGGMVTITSGSVVVDQQDVPPGTVTTIRADTRSEDPQDGGGPGGAVIVRANELFIRNGGRITADTLGPGAGGRIEIAADRVTLDDNDFVNSTSIGTQTAGELNGGPGGNIVLRADELRIVNGGDIDALTVGSGNGGTIDVTARSIVLDNQGASEITGITAATRSTMVGELGVGAGLAGDVQIQARDLQILNGADIAVTTAGTGHAGSVTVKADTVLMDGQRATDKAGTPLTTAINADSNFRLGFDDDGNLLPPGGDAGDVTVEAVELRILSGARISSITQGFGTGGDVTVSADRIFLDRQNAPVARGGGGDRHNTGIRAESATFGTGGNIEVTAREILSIENGANINASSNGVGNAGMITLAVGRALFDGGESMTATGVLSESNFPLTGAGNAGDVTIEADGDIEVRDRARISTSADAGDAGTLRVTARGDIRLLETRAGAATPQSAVEEPDELNVAQITVKAPQGAGGQVVLASRGVLLLRNSLVTAQAALLRAPGAPPDAPISAQISTEGAGFVVLDNSLIDGRIIPPPGAAMPAGQDVPVLIDPAATFIRSSDSQILSNAAEVPVEVDIAGQLSRLAGGLNPPASGLADVCGANLGRVFSSFVATGRGGAPVTPDAWSPSFSLSVPANHTSRD